MANQPCPSDGIQAGVDMRRGLHALLEVKSPMASDQGALQAQAFPATQDQRHEIGPRQVLGQSVGKNQVKGFIAPLAGQLVLPNLDIGEVRQHLP